MPIMRYVDVPAYVILTILGLVICFWGRQLSRFISSIAFASFLGYVTWLYSFRMWGSVAISIILMFIAAAIGFVLGFTIYRVAISILFGYITASIIAPERGILLLLLILLFATIIYILSNYLLSLLFAATGAIMIYEGVATLGLEKIYAIALCIVIFALGLYNQIKSKI
ncbi:MAG: hypothetical protein QXF17_06880 [Ignisphaera sp.]